MILTEKKKITNFSPGTKSDGKRNNDILEYGRCGKSTVVNVASRSDKRLLLKKEERNIKASILTRKFITPSECPFFTMKRERGRSPTMETNSG